MQEPENQPEDPRSTMLGLVKVMEWSLFLALGVLATLIGSVRKFGEDHGLQFNLWTLLAPAIVLTLNRLFWRNLRRRVQNEDFGGNGSDGRP